jgi:hypothetical protein
MPSPFASALTKLDGSLLAIQSHLDLLQAGLDVNDGQLNQSMSEARHHAATLRDLIRADRPDAKWTDRKSLEHLIHELEIAAKARRNQQRRAKLLELANELDNGLVQHRFKARAAALNQLRVEAVNELRTEAALTEQVKELPGPLGNQWIHWVCSLQEDKDALVLADLRRDFVGLERFAREMEEDYWASGQRGMRPAETFRQEAAAVGRGA